MMKRLACVLFAAGALLALAIAAAACGGNGNGDDDDGGGALQDYFQEIEQIGNDYLARSDAMVNLYQQLITSSTSDDVQTQAFLFLVDTSSKNIREEIDARNEVDPPSEVEKAHLEWLAAARVLAKVYEDVADRSSEVQTSSDLRNVVEEVDYESRLAEASDRAKRACLGLQEIADENEIDVGLCPR